MDELEKSLSTLSLSELRERLEARGVKMSLPSLSEFVKTDNVAEILNVAGKSNRLEIPVDAVDVIAAFWPEYKAAHGTLRQSAAMLRSFLNRLNSEGGAISVLSESPNPLISEFRELFKAAIPPLADKFLTLREAKEETGLFLWQLKTLPRYDGKVSRLDAQNLLRQRKENQR